MPRSPGVLHLRAAVLAATFAAGPAAGAPGPAALEVVAAPLRLTHAGHLRVELRNAGAEPRRVSLQADTATSGLRCLALPVVAVPAGGSASAELRVFRGAAAWGSRHEVRVVALDGGQPLALAETVVEVGPDPALGPRLRPWLAGLGLVLLVAAFVREARASRS